MDNDLFDLKVYARYVTDELDKLGKKNSDRFTNTDLQIISDAINLIMHNVDYLQKK